MFEDSTEKSIKPFQFRGLKKISRHHLEIEKALLNYLPFSMEGGLKKSLEEFLTKQFNLKASIHLERFEETQMASFVKELPNLAIVASLGMEPLPQKAFVWLDSVLAFSLIDRVLGGGGETPGELKSPTSIEEGVLQYLILKALSEAFQSNGGEGPIHFRLEQVLKSQKDLQAFSMDETMAIRLNYKIQVGDTLGFIVVILPHPLAEAAFLNRNFLHAAKGSREYEYSEKRFGNMAYVRTHLWAEIASVSLTLAEKNQLEKDDVILFDHSSCNLVGGQLQGNVVLRIGEGRGGGFLSQVISSGSPALVKVLDYYGGE